jgi:hypothetical protein
MITDETYFVEERKIREIFEEAGWTETPKPDLERIEAITERATLEAVLKDSTSFIFLSFTTVIASFLSAFFGAVHTGDDDYKA